MRFNALLNEKLDLVAHEYKKSTIPWVIGYSGGKDSTLVVKLIFESLLRVRTRHIPLRLVYCDTGVEIPIISEYVKKTIIGIESQANSLGIPLTCHLASPSLDDRYFVKVIGRGYAPPTNKFRWCTDVLRIKPIQTLMKTMGGGQSIVVLGVRHSESEERKRILAKNSTDHKYYFSQSQSESQKLFCPIVDFDTSDVWEALFALPSPSTIDVHQLGLLYKQASGECPVIREAKGTPCGKGRFGCWTCTVVRKDKAVQGLVDEGHANLFPLLKFRNWLLAIRDDPEYRCTVRRNGQFGLGPFRLKARQQILSKLLKAETISGIRLINQLEIGRIYEYWTLDKDNLNYFEDSGT